MELKKGGKRMDGVDRFRRRRTLQERLGVGLVCCGSTWDIEPSTMGVRDGDDDDEDDEASVGDDPVDLPNQLTDEIQTPLESNSNPDCVLPSPRMSLADVLEAERQSRPTTVAADGGDSLTSGNDNDVRLTTTIPVTPARVSLMRLLEETDDHDEKEGGGMDPVCCVCMRRKKGAAFIPCGHTFCRVCSRELWLNRGSCPLCNRSILEILDIY
uniref:RING-type domain-containing protein n=2 Tax=Lactuca sativa TaxID=4236 RepID=A0A9R1X5F5_LACSA|nr:hypothetical protein LSAT_V11C700348080 [Lactuca sativa]